MASVARLRQRVAEMAQRLRVVVDHQDGHRVRGVARRDGAGRGGTVGGRLGHRDRKGEARAEADAAALGPDAPPLGLDQALADGEAQPAAEAALPVPGGGVFTEQLAELVRRDALALVGDRDRHRQPLALRRDPDGRGVRRVARGVGEQVVEHLHQALPVRHDPGQVGRQVDADGVPPAAADERAARLVHQHGDIRRLGRDRQRAGVDAPGVEQVADRSGCPCGRPARR